MPEDKALVRDITKALQDFGYSVTEDYVARVVAEALEGKRNPGGPALFIWGWLEEAGMTPKGKS